MRPISREHFESRYVGVESAGGQLFYTFYADTFSAIKRDCGFEALPSQPTTCRHIGEARGTCQRPEHGGICWFYEALRLKHQSRDDDERYLALFDPPVKPAPQLQIAPVPPVPEDEPRPLVGVKATW